MSATEPRIYAYGIMWLREADDVAAALPDYGICGRVVRILACGRLAALVTDLPPQALPDDVWRDPDRIKDLILDHHRVLHGAARDRSVLPLRFGAVFSDDHDVATALAKHHQALCEALERIDGAREWGVKMFCDHGRLHSRLNRDTDVRVDPAAIDASCAGRAFFVRRRNEHRIAEDMHDAIVRRIVESRRLLSGAARTIATLRIQPPTIHRRADEMVWNSAFLVARDQESRFAATVDRLRDIAPIPAFDYELNGPWAPCSFAHLSLGSARP